MPWPGSPITHLPKYIMPSRPAVAAHRALPLAELPRPAAQRHPAGPPVRRSRRQRGARLCQRAAAYEGQGGGGAAGDSQDAAAAEASAKSNEASHERDVALMHEADVRHATSRTTRTRRGAPRGRLREERLMTELGTARNGGRGPRRRGGPARTGRRAAGRAPPGLAERGSACQAGLDGGAAGHDPRRSDRREQGLSGAG